MITKNATVNTSAGATFAARRLLHVLPWPSESNQRKSV